MNSTNHIAGKSMSTKRKKLTAKADYPQLHLPNDGTKRKQAEVALVKTGALQNAIFNSANFSSIATDAKGVIQIFNVGAERMLGYSAADVVNKITPADISDPQELVARAMALSVEFSTQIAPGFEALVFKASRGIEDIYELTYIRKDGGCIPAVVSVTALRDTQSVIIGYLLIGTDNTARKQIEADRKRLSQCLRDQQFYTRSLFESNIDALMTTDPCGIITDVNKQMEALTECTRDELIGSPFMSYFTDPERAETSIKLVLNKGTITNYELTARSRDGRETAVSYNGTTLYDRARKLLGVFAAARDITDRKRMEDEIIGLSLTDELTGLNNRRGFTLLAEQEMKLAKRIKRSMLLFFSDVDKLKVINDSLGHAQGDVALKEVADILKETFREADILARIGGDEFVILALDASMESAEILTDRIQATLKRRNQQGDQIYQLSISIGIARYDPDAPCTLSELIAQADGLMYHQKQTKKRKVVRISHQETTKGQIQ